MQSGNSGKLTITSIKATRKGMEIILDDEQHTKISILAEVYSEFYLYTGKSLTNIELQAILHRNGLQQGLQQAHRLLASKSHSILELKEKLLRSKKLGQDDVREIILILQEQKLLDDKDFKEEYIEYALSKNKSCRKIKDDLRKRGITLKETERIGNEGIERESARQFLLKSLYKMRNYSYLQQKLHLQTLLVNAGFDSLMARQLIDENVKLDEGKEKELLKKDHDRALQSYQNRYEGRKLKQHIVSFLERKGYHYSEITKIMEVDSDELD